MKGKKITAISLTLASALVSAGLGGALLAKNVSADAATYSLSNVFVGTSATIAAKSIGSGDDVNSVTSFSIQDDGKVQLKNSVALKWFVEEGEENAKVVTPKYFSTTFAFAELNFDSVTFTMQSQSAWTVEDSRSTNEVKFAKAGDNKLSVTVNEQTAVEIDYTAGNKLTLSLGAGTADGQFKVLLNGQEIGTFENVGANFAEYTVGKQYPFAFSADMPKPAEGQTAAQALVYLYDINGQQFDKLSDGKIVDNAAPVLVVNEEINNFLRGAAFSLDYTVIDVLKTKNVTKDLEYYQYNPSIATDDEAYERFEDLSTAIYFLDTTCYVDDASGNYVVKGTEGAKATTVYKKDGRELVAIKVNVNDGSKNANYDFAWYATAGVTEEIDGIKYIPIKDTQKGAEYKVLTANDTTKVNDKVADYETLCEAFQTELQRIATGYTDASGEVIKGKSIGQNLEFPSMAWLFADDNGYRNLKFTVCYKTQSSSAQSASGLLYNAVKFEIEEEGTYEVRVFAVDKAGNPMKYYNEDKELVDVTTSNVWDIEGIPTFTFDISNQPLQVKDSTTASTRRDTKTLDQTYTLSNLTVHGSANVDKAYKLYTVDLTKFAASDAGKASGKILSRSDLWAVSYEDLAASIDWTKVDGDNYFAAYLEAYAKELAEVIGVEPEKAIVDAIKNDCFTEVKEYNSRITEENDPTAWNAYNKFKWNADAQTFETVEEGEYLILADFADQQLPKLHRAAAYKVVVVDSKADVIDGENNWLKNNLVSVILFSFAGLCLIALVVLLLVKPSSETLEDLDAKAAKKAAKKEKTEDK